MEIPIRLENAITKLYTAFHEGTLDALDCTKCAVGNICNNHEEWKDSFILVETKESIKYHNFKANELILETGYSHLELANVEQIFVNGYNVAAVFYVGKSYWTSGTASDGLFGLYFDATIETDRFYCFGSDTIDGTYGKAYNGTWDVVIEQQTNTAVSNARGFWIVSGASPLKTQFLVFFVRATSATTNKVDSIKQIVPSGSTEIVFADMPIYPCKFTGTTSITAGSIEILF